MAEANTFVNKFDYFTIIKNESIFLAPLDKLNINS